MTNLPPHLQDIRDKQAAGLHHILDYEDIRTYRQGFQACYEAMVGDMKKALAPHLGTKEWDELKEKYGIK